MLKTYNIWKKHNWIISIYHTPESINLIRVRFGRWGFNIISQHATDVFHDHINSFWTFPLSPLGYTDATLQPDGEIKINHYTGWKWTLRKNTEAHIYIGPGALEKYIGINPVKQTLTKIRKSWTLNLYCDDSKPYFFWIHQDNIPVEFNDALKNIERWGDYYKLSSEQVHKKQEEMYKRKNING